MRCHTCLLCLLCLITVGMLSVSCFTPATPDNTTDASDVAQGELYVDIYDATQTYDGTTFLPDLHDSDHPRIIEVNMQGQVVWEYLIPDHLAQFRDPGMDVEVLADGNPGSALVMRLANFARHLLNRNTLAGSRRNMHRHYDLSNRFF